MDVGGGLEITCIWNRYAALVAEYIFFHLLVWVCALAWIWTFVYVCDYTDGSMRRLNCWVVCMRNRNKKKHFIRKRLDIIFELMFFLNISNFNMVNFCLVFFFTTSSCFGRLFVCCFCSLAFGSTWFATTHKKMNSWREDRKKQQYKCWKTCKHVRLIK